MTNLDPAPDGDTSRLGSSYFVEGEIGRGIMGAVYAGRSVETGEPVAIKLLHSRFSDNEAVVARFLQERNIVRLVSHPNVVSVHDLVIQGDRLAIVMELVDGGDLKAALAANRFSPVESIDLIAQVALGLDAIHRAGIIHRDPKPANILLGSTPEGPVPKLTDFGLARLLAGAEGSMTTSVGTPLYMSPEIGSGADRAGPWSDVYSVGAVLFEALTGSPMFEGVPAEVIVAHINRPAPAIEGVPPELSDLVAEMLDKQPEARPDAAEVARRLKAIGRSLDGQELKPVAVRSEPSLASQTGDGGVESPEQECSPGVLANSDDADELNSAASGSAQLELVDPSDPDNSDDEDDTGDELTVLNPPSTDAGRGFRLVGALRSAVHQQRVALVTLVALFGLIGIMLVSNPPSDDVTESTKSALAPLVGSASDEEGEAVGTKFEAEPDVDEPQAPISESASLDEDEIVLEPAADEGRSPEQDNDNATTSAVDSVASEAAVGGELSDGIGDDGGSTALPLPSDSSDNTGETVDTSGNTLPDGNPTATTVKSPITTTRQSNTTGTLSAATAVPPTTRLTPSLPESTKVTSTTTRSTITNASTSEPPWLTTTGPVPTSTLSPNASNFVTNLSVTSRRSEIVVSFTTSICVQVRYYLGSEGVDTFPTEGPPDSSVSCQTNHRMSLPVDESGTYRIVVEVTTANGVSVLLGPFAAEVVVDGAGGS